MDLKVSTHTASDAERAAVDSVLGGPPDGWMGGVRDAGDFHAARGGHAVRDDRERLLPVLHAVNEQIGWISRGAVNYVAQRMLIAPAEVYGVASFYGLFSTTEREARQVHACVDLACQLAGASVPEGAHASPCLGLCERAPAVLLVESGPRPSQSVLAPATPVAVHDLVGGAAPTPESAVEIAVPQLAGSDGADGDGAARSAMPLLGRVGLIDPLSIDDYLLHGGGRALAHARSVGSAAVIEAITASGLVGRGGAAFPTGRKWAAVAGQPVTERYLVCNADESEPGTFKDRVIMEGDPFSLVEAMVVAAETTGCQRAYLYLRGEYPRATTAMANAIDTARAAGWFRDGFDIVLFRGAGAYICGEETAIFNSIEGYRGEPRNKPPFPVEAGLFGKPTVVNNVETLVNVLPILHAHTDGRAHTESKLFCLSGAVQRPGVYEIPFGPTLGDLIDLAGGLPDGRSLQAVLLGGAAGSFATADDLSVPLTMADVRAAGLTLGSGVVMVLDDHADLAAFLLRIAAFFRDESCGQCVPCRVGTVRQDEVLRRLLAPTSGANRGCSGDDRALYSDIVTVMRDASICGLGQTAANAIESAIRKLVPA
jgi:NADH-quinone oxidoreductase subunit F